MVFPCSTSGLVYARGSNVNAAEIALIQRANVVAGALVSHQQLRAGVFAVEPESARERSEHVGIGAELLDGAIIEGSTIQPLRLVMPDGSVLVALYEMQKQADGGWRIAGCVIAPSTVRSA